MDLIDFIDRIKTGYSVNKRIWNMALVFLVSTLVLNYPWLLNWLPESARADVFLAADQVLKYGILIVLMWVKDSRVTGNGTLQKPYRKAGKGDH